MAESLGAGLTLQQLLAFGLVGLFAGAVKLTDVLYRPVALRPIQSSLRADGEERALENERHSVLSLDE